MRRYLILAVAFALVAISSLVLMPNGDATRIIILPDGKTVEFLGSTIGNQTFTTEKRWHKMARRFLPVGLQNWIPAAAASATCSSGTNSITVYFKVSDPTGKPVQNTPWQSYSAEDEQGFQYNIVRGGYCAFGGGASSKIYGLILNALPRRDSSFRFHFLGAEDVVMGSLTIPNPVSGPFAKWTPLPLPQTATNGPVLLTVESLLHYDSKRWQSVGSKWKLETSSPQYKRAKVRSTTLFDATGNEAQWLSSRESAWKLNVVMHRERDEDFLPDERWLLKSIAIPTKGQFTAVDQTTNVLGVNLLVQVVSSPGRFYVTNGVSRALESSNDDDSGPSSSWTGNTRVESWGYKKPFLLLQVLGREPEDEIRIAVFDEQGRKLNTDANHTDIGATIYRTRFDIPPEAKSLSLEVIVSRPLVFEFMVNPKDVQAAKSLPK